MTYEYVIAGAGAAGLSLALHLAASRPTGPSMLLIEPDLSHPAEHAWGFWANQPTLFDSIVQRSWQRLCVTTSRSERQLEARTYRYAVLAGADFRQYAHARLVGNPGVNLLGGAVAQIVDGRDAATVVLADGRTYDGRWVFDSRYRPASPAAGPAASCPLWQCFEGWEIEVAGRALDDAAATLMDFRIPQERATRFAYVLPLSGHRALVEHVTCGSHQPSRSQQELALAGYVERVLGIREFRILRHERGASPLTTRPFPRQVGSRVMTIGIAGGRIKPSTGYAFMRIQRDSEAITRSLRQTGQPFALPPDSPRHRRYDAVLLELMRHRPELVEVIFDRLFARNSLDRIFRFLDEATCLTEEARLAASLPPWFWLRALVPAWIERSAPCISPRVSS
jgi:lycopene beta-cyclase